MFTCDIRQMLYDPDMIDSLMHIPLPVMAGSIVDCRPMHSNSDKIQLFMSGHMSASPKQISGGLSYEGLLPTTNIFLTKRFASALPLAGSPSSTPPCQGQAARTAPELQGSTLPPYANFLLLPNPRVAKCSFLRLPLPDNTEYFCTMLTIGAVIENEIL